MSGSKIDKRDQIANDKIGILIVGPGSKQIGGVSTFTKIILSSPRIASNFRMIHLDTTRDQSDIGLENRLSITNFSYLFHQLMRFVSIMINEKPRLMHLPITSGVSFWKSALFIMLGKAFGIKVVAHLHGGTFNKYYWRCKLFERKLIGWVFHQADVVIALSEGWRKFLQMDIRSDLHVEVISNTVDLMFAEATSEPYDNRASREKHTILFLGSLGCRKGVFDILKAIPLVCAKFPTAYFLFAGDEEKRGEKFQIDRICEDQNLTKNIRFVGKVTGVEKLRLFQSATVYILPSYGENLPYSLLEAMAVGLPIVATSVGAIPEIIQNGLHGFLIQPGDYKGLAERIVKILEEPELQQVMSSTNIRTIKKSFLPESVLGQFEQLYKKLIFGN